MTKELTLSEKINQETTMESEHFLTCSECGEKFPFESHEHICKTPIPSMDISGEFNLSEKRINRPEVSKLYPYSWYHEVDVKEFIRLLKDMILNWEFQAIDNKLLVKEINKLAGESLI